MKINIIIDGIYESGGMEVIFKYANHLHDKGHDIVLYYPIIPYNYYRNNFNYINYLNLIKDKAAYFLFKNRIIKRKYTHRFKIKPVLCINNQTVRDADISIATRWPTSYSVAKFKNEKGKKYYFIQGYETWDSNIEAVENSYKLNLNRITISHYLKNILKKKFNVESDVVHNGIDFKNFYNKDKKYEKKDKTILFIDRSQKIKGIDICLEVIEKLNKKYNNLIFKCFSFKKYHQLPEYIEFIDNPSKKIISELYSEADIFLFPSLEEGFGLPPAEAMACQCAVISTKVGAVIDYSENNKSSILVEPGNADEMFNASCLLIEDPILLKTISLNGYNNIINILSWEKSFIDLEKILFKQ